MYQISCQVKENSTCWILMEKLPNKINTITRINKNYYYAYFHSILTYGLIFWGYSTQNVDIFKLKRKELFSNNGHQTQTLVQNISKLYKYYL